MMRILGKCSIPIILCWILILSCKKESFISSSDARLQITADTVKFDTVFTSTGSVTQSFKVINDNDQKLLLSSVVLMGGTNSAYKMNVNGIPATELSNIEIAANDSIYVFVSVTVNPTSANLPFIISDSIRFSYNGNNRYVQLEAFGQNAHFLRNETISSNTVFTNDLPYVILGGLQVDTGVSLLIEEGCRIYVHANAPILIDGTLQCTGTKNNEVVFTGDRLDAAYRDLPASWPGIYFRNTSADNRLHFTVIKNATQAVTAIGPSVNSNPKLQLQQCIIQNALDAGIFSSQSYIRADNCLISNCGNNIFIQSGGSYHFTNCTVAAYSNQYLLHNKPVLQLFNYSINNGSIVSASLDAVFENCIFWGDGGAIDDEVLVAREGNDPFMVTMEHCLYKAQSDPSNVTLNNIIRNADPLFDSIDIGNKYYDFRITKDITAPGIDQGMAVPQPTDLDDVPRTAGLLPDLGCYEKQ